MKTYSPNVVGPGQNEPRGSLDEIPAYPRAIHQAHIRARDLLLKEMQNDPALYIAFCMVLDDECRRAGENAVMNWRDSLLTPPPGERNAYLQSLREQIMREEMARIAESNPPASEVIGNKREASGDDDPSDRHGKSLYRLYRACRAELGFGTDSWDQLPTSDVQRVWIRLAELVGYVVPS